MVCYRVPSQGARWRLCVGVLLPALLLMPCVTWAASSEKPKPTGITVLDDNGKEKPISAAEVATLGGENPPYLLQVGDAVNVAFRIATLRENQPAWDYRIEVGDSMEVRLTPDTRGQHEYKMDVGDVVSVGFLDNWELSVTRTVRVDGRITVTHVGDVEAAGKTPSQLRDTLKDLYAKTGIIQGEPQITVNVDFINQDRYESLSRDVTVRANGAIRLPTFTEDVKVAGLTVGQACEAIQAEAAKTLRNTPVASMNIMPAVNVQLNAMKGTLVVQPDGKLSAAGLEPIQAAGYGLSELKQALTQACKGLCYNAVEPLVTIAKMTGSRFYVGGEVKIPGVYPLDASPTALQALIMAQGLTKDSRMKSVMILRRNPNGKPFVIKTDLKAAATKGFTDNDVPLRPFDVIYVPQKNIAKVNDFVDRYINRLLPFDKAMGVNASYYMNTQKVESKSRSFGYNSGTSQIQGLTNP